jgi:3-methyladenine DNA glycosylase AlkC
LKKQTTFSLKDMLFNQEKVVMLATNIAAVYPDFDAKTFIKTTVEKFPELELKQRIAWIREQLYAYLPKEYQTALEILVKALPAKLDPSKTDNDFGDFIYAPLADYVARYGRDPQHVKTSLTALKEMTMRFSAENAIRYFLNSFPQKTLEQLSQWTTDSNYHVRRLVSEGTRPKLPWAQKIAIEPQDALPLLDHLFFDKTRYVTRSVANHVNDISKIHPKLAIDTLQKWQQTGKQSSSEMQYIITHALRTLVKAGNEQALEMLGYTKNPAITISNLEVQNKTVKVGNAIEFSFDITAQANSNLLIDYILHFQNKNSQMKNKKVHKIKKLTLKKGATEKISKKHPLRPMTTRALYPGKHKIEIQINGTIVDSFEFELQV